MFIARHYCDCVSSEPVIKQRNAFPHPWTEHFFTTHHCYRLNSTSVHKYILLQKCTSRKKKSMHCQSNATNHTTRHIIYLSRDETKDEATVMLTVVEDGLLAQNKGVALVSVVVVAVEVVVSLAVAFVVVLLRCLLTGHIGGSVHGDFTSLDPAPAHTRYKWLSGRKISSEHILAKDSQIM